MSIRGFGKEFQMLEALVRDVPCDERVIVPPGDDAAVIKSGGSLLALSSDEFLEERHFSFQYSSLEQVGKKCVEACVSDIFAMGAEARYLLINLSIPKKFNEQDIGVLYSGVYAACDRVGALLLGGDTVASEDKLALSIFAIGDFEHENRLCTRSSATPGDTLWVTGPLGDAAAGLALYQAGIEGHVACKLSHTTPVCQNVTSRNVAEFATAMIDISDGLSSELQHIALQSNVHCQIDLSRIPFSAALQEAANIMDCGPEEFFLHGGDDYQLLYALPKECREKGVGFEIGRVLEGDSKVTVVSDLGEQELLPNGWDHFK